MLKKLTLENFTVFEQAELDFAPGINIIIGENASGKSHLLKLAYCIAAVWQEDSPEEWKLFPLEDKLDNVFKITTKAQLQTLGIQPSAHTHITLEFTVKHKEAHETIGLTIDHGILFINQHPNFPLERTPLFLPTKEILSLYPNFTALYEKYSLAFDETYYDLCKAIDNPLLKQPDQTLINAIETIVGGKFVLKNNNFYLQTEQGEINIFMVAEGWRKLGMLAYLIANDSLKKDSLLFWDEPETNLNPRLIKQLAAILMALSRYGVQIVIATHNLFLMKYVDYLISQAQDAPPCAFFNLVRTQQHVTIEQGSRLSHLSNLVALSEELELYDKEQEAFYANLL
jgi:hypothetical protein